MCLRRGLVCLAGDEWKEGIAIDDTLKLNAVVPNVAVGDQGRWFKRTYADTHWNPWQEQAPLEQARLTQVTADQESLIIVGEESIQRSEGESAPTCAPPALHAMFLTGFDALAITTHGEVLRAREPQKSREPYCVSQQIELGEIIATSADGCVLPNPRVLTQDALVGQHGCITVP